MACGDVPKIIELKHKLSAVNFPELIFSIKSSKLKFDCVEGAFKQISNDDPFYKKPNENFLLATEEEKLACDIEAKKKKILYIKERIEEINKKIETMNKVLLVDLNERDYLNELNTICGNLKYKDLEDEDLNEQHDGIEEA
jgi:hypothetical protein